MPAALFLSPPPPFPSPQVRRRPRRNTLCTSSLLGVTSFVHNVLPLPHGCSSKCPHQYHLTPFLQPTNSNAPTPSPNRNEDTNEWVLALEELLLEALQTYYQGTPMFTDSEFQTLREELEHLGSAQIRLDAMEKVWVQATSSRDFDRRVRAEFEMSEDDLNALKNSLVRAGRVKRPIGKIDSRREDLSRFSLPPGRKLLNDAKRIDSTEPHQQGLQWYVFVSSLSTISSSCPQPHTY